MYFDVCYKYNSSRNEPNSRTTGLINKYQFDVIQPIVRRFARCDETPGRAQACFFNHLHTYTSFHA